MERCRQKTLREVSIWIYSDNSSLASKLEGRRLQYHRLIKKEEGLLPKRFYPPAQLSRAVTHPAMELGYRAKAMEAQPVHCLACD